MAGPSLFFVFFARRGRGDDRQRPIVHPYRRSRAECSKLRHKKQDGGKAPKSHLQKQFRAYGLQMESICEDDCNQFRFPKRGDAK